MSDEDVMDTSLPEAPAIELPEGMEALMGQVLDAPPEAEVTEDAEDAEEVVAEDAGEEDEVEAAGEEEEVDDEPDPVAAAKAEWERDKKGILRELAEERKRRQDWQDLYKAQFEKPQEEETSEEEVDKDEFPIDWLRQQQKKDAEALKQTLEAQQQQQAQVQAAQVFQEALEDSNDRAAEKHEDYEDALDYARDLRVKQYAAFGMGEDEARAAVAKEEIIFAAQKFQAGQDPAEAAYELARSLGYRPRGSAPKAKAGASPKEKARIAEKAAGKTTSLSQVPGSPVDASGKLTPTQFDALPHDDKIALLQRHPNLYDQFNAQGYATVR